MTWVAVVLLKRTRMFSFSNSKSVRPYSSTRSASSRISSILNEGSLTSFFPPRLVFVMDLSDSSAFAEAVISLIVHLLLQVLAFRRQLARIINQFDHSHLGIISRTPSEFDNSGVAAVAIFVPNTKIIKKSFHRSDAGGSFDRIFSFTFLSAKPASRNFERAVPSMKKPSGLTSKMHFAQSCAVSVKNLGLPCKRDRFFDERAKLFRFRKRRNDVFLLGIY